MDRREKAEQIIRNYRCSETDACFRSENLFNLISRSGAPILRNITSASIVFEGVRKGMDPKHTVMWTVLGYPVDAVAVPLRVDCAVPAALQAASDGHAPLNDLAMQLKKEGVDVLDIISQREEKMIREYRKLQGKYEEGRVSERKFSKKYNSLINSYLKDYLSMDIAARIAELRKND